MSDDAFDLSRFVMAQRQDYAAALAEIRAGRKRSHWMWYVFPQMAGLGMSSTSQYYGIKNRAEAGAYLADATLGPRLTECAEALMALDGDSATAVFGTPDDLKLRSSMTLFAAVSLAGSVFERVMAKFFGGQADGRTLALLGAD